MTEHFFAFSEKETKKEAAIWLQNGQPLVFGDRENKGIRLDGLKPVIVDLEAGQYALNDLWIHDEKDKTKAYLISRFFNTEFDGVSFPRPFGVLYAAERPVYEDLMTEQIRQKQEGSGKIPLNRILSGDKTWTIV